MRIAMRRRWPRLAISATSLLLGYVRDSVFLIKDARLATDYAVSLVG